MNKDRGKNVLLHPCSYFNNGVCSLTGAGCENNGVSQTGPKRQDRCQTLVYAAEQLPESTPGLENQRALH